MNTPLRLGVVILAGGLGERIGGDKPERHLGGRPLMAHVLAIAERWNVPIALSARRPMPGWDRYPLLCDETGEGPIAGLASALRFGEHEGLDAVLTLPCDTPLLPRDLLPRLGKALGPGAATPLSNGRLQHACTLWRTGNDAALATYLADGRSSLKGFAAIIGQTVVEWPGEAIDPFTNVNDHADLAAVEALLKVDQFDQRAAA